MLMRRSAQPSKGILQTFSQGSIGLATTDNLYRTPATERQAKMIKQMREGLA